MLEIEAAAIRGLIPQLDERFDRAVELLQSCAGRVVCTGMGKSGLVMKKIAPPSPRPARRRSSSIRPKRSTATSA